MNETPAVGERNMSAPGDVSRVEHAVTAAIAGALVVLGVVLWLVADTPWPLIAGASAIVVLALAQFASGTFAVAASAVLFVVAGVVVNRLAPLLGVGVDTVGLVWFAFLGAAGTAVLALPARHRTTRPGFNRAISAAVAPLVAVIMLLIGEITGSRGVLWAMHGDTAWNVISSRFMMDDGGLRPETHPNSSPSAAALLAMVAIVGRSEVGADLLRHDIDRLAQLWIALALLVSLLAALVAVHTPRLSTAGRWIAGVVAGLMPLSWYVMGFAWDFGFLNAPVALILLFAAWIGWLECRISPLRGAALLSVATVGMLATWAPLAAVPAALAVAALIADRRRIRRSLGALVAWIAVALPVPLYAIAVTLEDLQRDGAALAVNGGFPALSSSDTVVTMGVSAAIICTVAVMAGDRHRLVGIIAVGVAAVVGIGYLVFQRIPTGHPWGYYPAKMAWLIIVLLIAIAIGSLCAALTASGARRRASIAVGVVGAVALAGCMTLVPPIRQPILAQLFPWVDVVRGTGVAAPAEAPEQVFDLAATGTRALAARLGPHDAFINFWLLQLDAGAGDDPIRSYAYLLDSTDAGQVCDAIRAWGGDVVVHTADPALEAELEAGCPDVTWKVQLHG